MQRKAFDPSNSGQLLFLGLYVELPARYMEQTKVFFTAVFGWTFVDYGPDYIAFSNAGLEGGFYRSELSSQTDKGGALVVFTAMICPAL